MAEDTYQETPKNSHKQVASIFVDESGNKFDENMFKQSPFFVYAWLLLTKEQEEEINFRVSELRHREGIPKAGELRTVNMWSSARGRSRFNKLMRIIHDSGARAYVTFTEKRFEICVLICETYLDYMENNTDKYDEALELQKRVFKRQIMNALYHSVTDDFLNEFRDACVRDDTELISEIGNRLAHMLALHPDREVSIAARMFAEGAKTPYRFGRRIPDGPKNAHLITSHLSLFSISLNFFESELTSLGLKASIIRDQDSVHGEALDFVYGFLVKELQFKNLVGCRESISTDSIGLQLADLIAGATERVLRAKVHNRNLSQINRSIWAGLRLSLALGKWTYQLTADSCEIALESLWDYKTLPQVRSNEIIDPSNPLRCNCGEVISSGRIRDFYSHVIKAHPDAQILGIRCQFCKKLIPLWLGACHDVIEHNIEPPFRGDFYGDMQSDYDILQALLKSDIMIVEPKN